MAESSLTQRDRVNGKVQKVIAQAHLDLQTTRMRLTIAQKRIEAVGQQMQQLRAAGMVNAKPHYQMVKYLYLIHPQRNGRRVREYVGSNQHRIAEAYAKMARYKEYHELEKYLGELIAWLFSIQALQPVKLPAIPKDLQVNLQHSIMFSRIVE